jgi:hypothetical protein
VSAARAWLARHRTAAYALALLLLLPAGSGLFYAAQNGSQAGMLLLLGLIVLANGLVLVAGTAKDPPKDSR